MIAATYSAVRNNLKDYCEKAMEGETVIVTRKADRNVVVLSLDRYNEIMKELRNARYMNKLDRAFSQLEAGQGKVHELVEE